MSIFAHLEGASRVWVPTQAFLFGIQMLPRGGTGNPYAFRGLGKGRVVSTAHLQGASHVRFPTLAKFWEKHTCCPMATLATPALHRVWARSGRVVSTALLKRGSHFWQNSFAVHMLPRGDTCRACVFRVVWSKKSVGVVTGNVVVCHTGRAMEGLVWCRQRLSSAIPNLTTIP